MQYFGNAYYHRNRNNWAREYLKQYDPASLKSRESEDSKGKKIFKFLFPDKASQFLALLKPVDPRTRPKRVSKKKRLQARRGPQFD